MLIWEDIVSDHVAATVWNGNPLVILIVSLYLINFIYS